jgi:hypothetical protein
MIGDCGVALIIRPIPDFMGSGCLAIKRKTKSLQTPYDIAITKARQSSHLPANHKWHLETIRDRQGLDRFATFSPGLQ